MNQVLTSMPSNAIEALADALKTIKLESAPAAEAAAAAPVNQAALEAEIKTQGDLVRTMKEANKAAADTHSQEEVDAAVAKATN